MSVDIIVTAHADTVRLPVNELVRRLNTHLGATLVATLAGSKDSKLPYRWAKPDGPMPSQAARERLMVAHRIWQVLADAESEYVARTWFIGNNPLLDETPPVIAIREGQLADALHAAEAFVTGTWHG